MSLSLKLNRSRVKIIQYSISNDKMDIDGRKKVENAKSNTKYVTDIGGWRIV